MENPKINLFNLIDENEKRPGSWIMAKGERLNEFLELLISRLVIRFGSKRKITKYLQEKFNLSQSTTERFVFLMKEWHPLFLIKEISNLTDTSPFEIQEGIDFLKANNPPVKVYRAVKELTEDLCKIVGAHTADGTLQGSFFRINEGYKSNINAFRKWMKNTFGVDYNIKEVSSNEWAISFNSKIFSSYLRKIFDFPSGMKQYTVSEPKIIRNAPLRFRKAFAIGALTFEAGVNMSFQVELCVSSKAFRDSITEILTLHEIQFTNMQNKSREYWRLWSNKLSEDGAKKWMEFFELNTEKWFKLNDYVYGFQGKGASFEEVVERLETLYPSKSASKICLKDVLFAIKMLKKTHRYELVSYLCENNALDSYGGRWAHSIAPYLNILKRANIIFTKKERFGKKRSFGSIVREVYIYNPEIDCWKIPERFI